MAARDREPWIKVKIGIRRSGKLAALPSDTARLGWLYVLVEAKVQRTLGTFDNRAHFSEVMGRFGRYLDQYVEVGLIHVAPALCPECGPRHSTARRGEVIVHDYLKEQRDPTNADRQAVWRANQKEDEAGPTVTASITPPVTPGITDEAGPTVTADSRARGTTATATATTTENEEVPLPESEPHANGKGTRSVKGFTSVGTVVTSLAEATDDWKQMLTLAERDEWSSYGPEWDAFRSAWLARGFRHPPHGSPDDDPDAPNPSQRALLWSVLDAWPNDMPRWIAEAPRKLSASQVVALVIDRWHGKRDEGVERADRQDAEAAASKRAEAEPADDPRVAAFAAGPSWIPES